MCRFDIFDTRQVLVKPSHSVQQLCLHITVVIPADANNWLDCHPFRNSRSTTRLPTALPLLILLMLLPHFDYPLRRRFGKPLSTVAVSA